MTPKVSVVVPLFNKKEWVARALDSIAGQSFGDYEAIIVDDGSTDGSAELAAAYPSSRFRVIRQANSGPGAARNRGIEEARGSLVAFLDADDAWLPGFLAAATGLLDSFGSKLAAVTTGYVEFPPGIFRERMWRDRGLEDGIERVTPATPPGKLVHMTAFMWPCATVARIESVRRWGGFYAENNCRYGEDAALWLKVLLNEAVYFHMQPLAQYYRDASALSASCRGPRPLEPVLLDPADSQAACPARLRPLLAKYLAIKAAKTAAMLGYWGDWRRARQIWKQFVSAHDWPLPYFFPGLIGCTPLAHIAGPAAVRIAAALAPRGAFGHLRAGGAA